MSYQERALAIIDRLTDNKSISIRERGTLRRAILLPERLQEDLISAKDFKKRINNMEYIYIQSCAEDVIDAIDCEVTYFKEKMKRS